MRSSTASPPVRGPRCWSSTGCGSGRRCVTTPPLCYDAAVPEHAAATAAPGIDAYVASTPYGSGPEQAARRYGHMSRSALAHGMWVVVAASAGPSGVRARTSGGSGIRAPDGTPAVQAGPEPGAVVSATVGPDRAGSRRRPGSASRP
ncbi:nitrilase-related carbon-nitrogen hydrolase [Streptomyces sp. NPDC056230]|uniref:nitrilase-related carbon-nitrogen hydrolase n=1 Tax=Streptomyces sp. NPDC056230 TaxID=3345754 RepID=UPI0035E3B348